jgi:hypothetical protein
MKKFTPVIKVKGFATLQSRRLSEKTLEKTQIASIFFAEVASNQLGEIMVKINSGEGTPGMLIQDSTIAEYLNQTMLNLQHSSQGLDENMEMLRHNFLFRRYYKRKAKKEEQLRIDTELKN